MTSSGAEAGPGGAPLVSGIDPELDARLRDGLAAVQHRLEEVVAHDDPYIASATRYLVDAGGKRFRPLLTLLCAGSAPGSTRRWWTRPSPSS